MLSKARSALAPRLLPPFIPPNANGASVGSAHGAIKVARGLGNECGGFTLVMQEDGVTELAGLAVVRCCLKATAGCHG